MSEGISVRFVAILTFFAALAFTVPLVVVQASGTEADAQCVSVYPQCPPCGPIPPMKDGQCIGAGRNQFNCPATCIDTTNKGVTTGHCVLMGKCHGDTFSASAGQPGGATGMDQLMQALKGIMDALKGKGGGGGGGGGQPPSSGADTKGCTSYYQTSDSASKDPCSYYVPGGSTNSGLSSYNSVLPTGSDPNSLLNYYNSLNPQIGLSGPGSAGTSTTQTDFSGGTQQNTNEQLQNLFNTNTSGTNSTSSSFQTSVTSGYFSTSSNSNTIDNSNTSSNPDIIDNPGASNNSDVSNNASPLTPTTLSGTADIILLQLLGGARGNIELTPGGATIYAATRDEGSNTETSGFYGANTFGTEPQGIVARLCMTRPWASGALSNIISPSFFDGLCTWRGYRVGTPPPASATTSSVPSNAQTRVPAVSAQPRATTTPSLLPTVPPEVYIQAVPASVSLGARTAIFWNSRGVTDCLVTSPDGNFHETRLSGGAATTPITSDTTFTISCTAPDGTQVTDYVVVHLKT